MDINLKRFTAENSKDLPLLLQDIDVMKTTGFREVQSESSLKNYLNEWIESQEVWAVYSNNSFIGWGMLKAREENLHEIGYMLIKDFWNQGLGSKIAKALIAYAKAQNISELFGRVDKNNPASSKVLLKNDFIFWKEEDDLNYYRLSLNYQ